MADGQRKTAASFPDKFGKAVRVGDFIVYGHAWGRSACLKLGKILKIEMVQIEKYGYREGVKWTWEWSIRVQGVEDHYGPLELSKPGTLLYPERSVKVSIDDLPEKYLNLFEEETA